MQNLRLYDNTRLSDFKRCPRYFYYRHEQGWLKDTTELSLIFGSSWHRAMDQIWPLILEGEDKEEIIAAGNIAFLNEWISNGLPAELDYEAEKEWSPRTPGIAFEMIVGYTTQRYRQIREDFELLHIEKPFAVPLDPNDPTLFYIGKMDKVVRRRGRPGTIEHKTTTAYSKSSKFRSTFVDSFSPNSQVDGYAYALHMLFPGEKVGGVWVDAALVHKTENDAFMFIPVERQIQQLDGWLWETRSWIDQIEGNRIMAAEFVEPGDPYMAAFPKNTNSCFDFNRSCQYLDLCKAWPNPIGKPLPPGYTAKKWDPLEHLDATRLELPAQDGDAA